MITTHQTGSMSTGLSNQLKYRVSIVYLKLSNMIGHIWESNGNLLKFMGQSNVSVSFLKVISRSENILKWPDSREFFLNSQKMKLAELWLDVCYRLGSKLALRTTRAPWNWWWVMCYAGQFHQGPMILTANSCKICSELISKVSCLNRLNRKVLLKGTLNHRWTLVTCSKHFICFQFLGVAFVEFSGT